MPKPSPELSWATDTNFTNGPAVGTPTKVAPSVGIIAEGEVPKAPAFPQRTNWWRNKVATWVNYFSSWFAGDEVVYPVDKTRQVAFSAYPVKEGNFIWTGASFNGRDITSDVWRTREDSLTGFPLGGVECTVAGLNAIRELDMLRTGQVLTAVSVFVKPAAPEPLTGSRVFAGVYYYDIATGTRVLLSGSGVADATDNLQGITLTISGSHTVDLAARSYYVLVRSSFSSAPGGADQFIGGFVNVTEPTGTCGPRNY